MAIPGILQSRSFLAYFRLLRCCNLQKLSFKDWQVGLRLGPSTSMIYRGMSSENSPGFFNDTRKELTDLSQGIFRHIIQTVTLYVHYEVTNGKPPGISRWAQAWAYPPSVGPAIWEMPLVGNAFFKKTWKELTGLSRGFRPLSCSPNVPFLSCQPRHGLMC